MNIFSEDAFLEAFSRVYFPNQKVTPELFQLGGKLWRLPSRDSGEPIDKLVFFDFLEPLDELDDKWINTKFNSKIVCYLPRVSQKMVSCSEWIEQNLQQRFQAAPTIVWNQFGSWDAFTNHVKQSRSRLFLDSCRRQRKLEKELGPIQVIFDDRRSEVLETCFRWKHEYLHRKGLPDRFTNLDRMHLFQELSARKLLVVSSLSAKNHLLAVYISMVSKGRFYLWNTAYDLVYAQYSPGRLLLHLLLEQSFKLKHKEFDFLRGDQDYKWYYATHVRLIEDIGERPLTIKLYYFLKAALNPFPEVEIALKQLRNEIIRRW